VRGLVIVFVIGCGRIGFDDPVTSKEPAAAITVPQIATLLDTASTVTVDVAPTQAGDLLIVATVSISAQTHVLAVVDDLGDHFTSAGITDVCDENHALGELWFATAGASGTTTVSVMSSDNDQREVWLLEVAGVTSFDQIAKIDNATATTSVVAPSVSPDGYPAIVISELNDPSHIGDLAAGSPFMALPLVHGDDAAYAIVTTPGDYGAVWANTVSGEYCGFTAAFH
jgi:hypothetical protein